MIVGLGHLKHAMGAYQILPFYQRVLTGQAMRWKNKGNKVLKNFSNYRFTHRRNIFAANCVLKVQNFNFTEIAINV